jgi:F-type H+-transporting ATPase subunit b
MLKKTVLAAAHKEAEAVGERAKTAADTKAAEIVAAAQDKAAELMKSAEAKGEAMKAQALKESESEVAKLAILAAEKVLREKTN